MSFGVALQDPAETALYEFDWNSWGAILTSDWDIWPTQFSPEQPSLVKISPVAGITGVRVSGVQFGQVYELKNTVSDASGSVGEQSLTIRGGQK